MIQTAVTLLAMLSPAPLPSPATEAPSLIPAPQPIPIIKQVDLPVKVALDYAPFHFDPPGTHPNPYPVGQCTWLAASMKGNVPVWGDAQFWDDRAWAAGISVSDIPIVGSLGIERVGNHVVVVTAVNPGGTVTVEEGNYNYAGAIRSYTYPTGKFSYIWM